MRISKKGEYALRAMIHLSLNYQKGPIRIKDISRIENIPEKFLELILLELRKVGLLNSQRGLHGGYSLNKAPKDISLAEVIRIIDGPLAPLSCVSQWAHVCCPIEKNCGLHSVMTDVRNVIADMLEKITFKDVCARSMGMTENSK